MKKAKVKNFTFCLDYKKRFMRQLKKEEANSQITEG